MSTAPPANKPEPLSLVPPPLSTRDKILQEAQTRFSINGFHGTSIAELASAVGIRKPSLLHHFPSKQKLYGAVLKHLADGLLAEMKRTSQDNDTPKTQLLCFMESFYSWGQTQPEQATLILREMLDNPSRAVSAHNWYLEPFIEQVVGIIETGQQSGVFKPLPALAFIYNMIGAQHYFVVSLPTLKQILSAKDYKQLLTDQRDNILAIVEQQLFV